jgi:hypothetical protein
MALLVLGSKSYANTNDSLPKTLTKKNEIGLILNPIGIALLGAAPNGQRFGITYKRKLNESSTYLTSGVYHQSYKNDFEKGNEITLEINGLLRNIQYRNESENNTMLSLGAEQRWTVSQCPAIVTYLGAEMLLSYGNEFSNIGNQWMKADTSHGLEYSIQTLQADSNFIQTKRVKRNTFGGGIQFNAGVQLHLGKRFYLFAQAAPSFLFITGTRVEEDLKNNTTTKFKTSQFDFDMRAIVSDIGLVYKF